MRSFVGAIDHPLERAVVVTPLEDRDARRRTVTSTSGISTSRPGTRSRVDSARVGRTRAAAVVPVHLVRAVPRDDRQRRGTDGVEQAKAGHGGSVDAELRRVLLEWLAIRPDAVSGRARSFSTRAIRGASGSRRRTCAISWRNTLEARLVPDRRRDPGERHTPTTSGTSSLPICGTGPVIGDRPVPPRGCRR